MTVMWPVLMEPEEISGIKKETQRGYQGHPKKNRQSEESSECPELGSITACPCFLTWDICFHPSLHLQWMHAAKTQTVLQNTHPPWGIFWKTGPSQIMAEQSHPVVALPCLRISPTKVPWHLLGIQELLLISDSIFHKPLHAQVNSWNNLIVPEFTFIKTHNSSLTQTLFPLEDKNLLWKLRDNWDRVSWSFPV